jgi:hypothetical protein
MANVATASAVLVMGQLLSGRAEGINSVKLQDYSAIAMPAPLG